MSRPYVMAIVEGSTEQTFIKKVLAPYLSQKGIDIVATQISKPGQKGGDVTFTRVVKDIKQFLRQPQITAITTMIDLYGLRDWPQKDKIFQQSDHSNRIDKLYNITQQALVDEFQEKSTKCIPYFSLYEFEALLFSNPAILAQHIGCKVAQVQNILKKYGEPERINNSPHTAPSKRIESLSDNSFKKMTTGITVAKTIGVDTMRAHCPQFHRWLERLENLVSLP